MQLRFIPSVSEPVAGAFHLTPFVTADLRFDIAAIRAEAKARYADKLDFINRYDGKPRRHWQWCLARRAVELAWREARADHHRHVLARMPHHLPYTSAERVRMDQLRAVMDRCAVSMRGNAEYGLAAGELSTISKTAHRRAYDAVIADARGEG